MGRLAIPVLVLFLAATRGFAAEQGQLDTSPALFTVMAALHAAGYDADWNSPANHPLRKIVRQELAKKNIPCLQDLRVFYESHRQKDATAELSQYISFALSVKGPPDFEFTTRRLDVPPDADALEGLGPLLVRFYGEAGIEDLWKRAHPAFDEAIARYHEPVSRAVLEANAYLRNVTSGYLGRRFQIYLELLGPPNQIQTRSYGDDFFVVLTPSPEPQVADVRHAYLFFLLDPLATKYSDRLAKKKALIDYAQNAPALNPQYKSDFLLLATGSLVRAVESRMARKPNLIDEALREGFILTPHFAEQLAVFEKQQQAMRLYYPEMLTSIDLKKEERRLEGIEFASAGRVRKAKVVEAAPPPAPVGASKTLEDAEQLYTSRNLEKARQTYMRALQETQEPGLHARAYYGLARIAVLQKNPEMAERLFQKTLESSPDSHVQAWTYVYLGRLSDAAGDRGQATAHYKQALTVQDASTAARQAAEKGLQQNFGNRD